MYPENPDPGTEDLSYEMTNQIINQLFSDYYVCK